MICPGLKSSVGEIYLRNTIEICELMSPIILNMLSEKPMDPFESNKKPQGENLTDIEPLLIADHVAPDFNPNAPL